MTSVAIQPASGSITVPGFKPGAAYALERWDTYAPGGRVASAEHLVADSTGTLTVRVDALSTDLALKLRPVATTMMPSR